jgi:hypothetical protein
MYRRLLTYTFQSEWTDSSQIKSQKFALFKICEIEKPEDKSTERQDTFNVY